MTPTEPDTELGGIRQVFRERRYLVRDHFRLRLQERGIDLAEVAGAVRDDEPEVTEDYPDDARGASCLILCRSARGVWYHVHCSRPPDVWLITAYQPDPIRWTADFRRRTRP